METIPLWLIQLILIPALSPFFIGVTRKMKPNCRPAGRFSFQPYRTGETFPEGRGHQPRCFLGVSVRPYAVYSVTISSAPPFRWYRRHLRIDSPGIPHGDIPACPGTFILALAGSIRGAPSAAFGSSRETMVRRLPRRLILFTADPGARQPDDESVCHCRDVASLSFTICRPSYSPCRFLRRFPG